MGEGSRERAGREARSPKLSVVLIPSPGTDTVVPYFAVVDGLAAHTILGMDIGTILHEDLHTAQQALLGCQVQGRGAIACLAVEGPARGKRAERKDKGTAAHQIGGQTNFQPCSAIRPLGDPGMSLLFSVPQFPQL